MGYEPIKVIASAASADGHVNRITEFDDVPQSNKLSYRDGFPILTATPNGQNTRGPRRVDLNGLFYLFSSNLFELQQGNFPTYNSAIVGTGKPLPDGYPLGAVLWYPTGGYFVKSLIADNTESDLTDTTKWAKITISQAEIDNIDLSKANIALDNVSSAGKETSVGWAMPDFASMYSYSGSIDNWNNLTIETLPKDSLVTISSQIKYYGTLILRGNSIDMWASGISEDTQRTRAGSVVLPKGTIVSITGYRVMSYNMTIIPLKGA